MSELQYCMIDHLHAYVHVLLTTFENCYFVVAQKHTMEICTCTWCVMSDGH